MSEIIPTAHCSIEPACPNDRDAILAVMRHFNMHHVPSVEMEELDLSRFFVARMRGRVVGAAGYRILSPTEAKTTLLGVLPQCSGMGIGKELQHRRMAAMHEAGIRKLITNADRPDTVLWYKKHYGYRQVGTLKKLCHFGLDDVDHWTTLETDLDAYFSGLEERERRKRQYIAQNDAHPLAPYPPLIINVCLTGMIPTHVQTPHVPLSVDEIVEAAIEAHDAGAQIVHLHARDAEGEPTPDPSYYERIIRGIRRERPGMICGATTSGRNWSGFEQRAAVLYLDEDARPDMYDYAKAQLATNRSLIERIVRIAQEMQRPIATPAQAREIIGLSAAT